jgi:hypothetical protein
MDETVDNNDSELNDIEDLRSSNSNAQIKKADNLNFFAQGKSDTEIPVDVTFGEESHELFQEKPPETMPTPSIERPGNIQTFAGRFGEQSSLNQLYQYNNRLTQDNSPLDDYVDPNWNPSQDKSAFIGIDPRKSSYLYAATGPKDLIRRKNYILDQQENEDKLSRGNLFFQLAGGFTGASLGSPENLLMIGTAAKYAKMSTEFVQTLPKIIGGISLSSASHEAVIQSTKIGGNLQDWAVDTFADTVMATVFMGVGIGAKHLMEAQKLYNAKGLINILNKDIEPRAQINEKGELIKWRATPMNSSVNAKEVDLAQVYLDGSMAKNSLYSIPYVGDKIGYAAGEAGAYLAGKVSPIVRNLHSKYPIMRGLMNNISDHGIDTVATESLKPNEDSFSHMMDMIAGTNTSLFKQYKGLYMMRNGITYNEKIPLSQSKAQLREFISKKLSNDHTSEVQFGREVQNSIINDETSDHAAVNIAARMINDSKDPIYREWLKLNGYSEKIIPPKTSTAHFMRVYHAAYMDTLAGEEHWNTVVPIEIAKDDAEISSLMQPIENAKQKLQSAREEHDSLVSKETLTDAEVKQSSENIDVLLRRKNKLEHDLQNNLRDNSDLHRHLDDINAVSDKESRQIIKLHKPIAKLEKEIDKQKNVVSSLKGKKFFSKAAAEKSKTQKTAKNHANKVKEHENLITIEEAKLDELKTKLDEEKEKLLDKIYNGDVDTSLVNDINATRGNMKLKDPTNKLKLREVYKSDGERQNAARAYYDTILSQTSEDNIRNIMGRMMNNPKENPLGRRTLMLRDQFLYDNNFLHPDPIIALMNYRQTLGRKNAIKTVLNRLTINGTYEELIKEVEKTYKTKRSEATTEKQNKREGRIYKAVKKDLELIIGKLEGRSKYSQTAREYSNLANLWAVSTKLGFLPMTMSTDLMANVFKHGFWPTIRDGLLPMLSTLNGMLATSEADAIRQEAAHAHIAMLDTNMAYSDKNWTGTSQTYEPIKGKLTTGLETLAHYSMNFSGANYVENFLQRFTAQVIQSKIIKGMLDFQTGKLSLKDHKSLLRYGLDPKEWSERIIKEWKAVSVDGKGDGNGFGGYRSNYWKWQDLEASNRVSSTIMRGVKDTIIRRGKFDVPFAMDNPIINSIFLFKGYTLTSINRFLVPLLQKPEAEKIVGTLLMMAAGATQNPLRRISNGQDPHQEDDHMFRNAMRDGGVFSSFMDTYEDANFLVNGLFQENVTNERYRNRTEMGAFNGPAFSAINDMTRIIGMVGRQEWNQQDIKKFASNVPFVWSWELRRQVSKMIDGMGVPKTREQAHKIKSIEG